MLDGGLGARPGRVGGAVAEHMAALAFQCEPRAEHDLAVVAVGDDHSVRRWVCQALRRRSWVRLSAVADDGARHCGISAESFLPVLRQVCGALEANRVLALHGRGPHQAV